MASLFVCCTVVLYAYLTHRYEPISLIFAFFCFFYPHIILGFYAFRGQKNPFSQLRVLYFDNALLGVCVACIDFGYFPLFTFWLISTGSNLGLLGWRSLFKGSLAFVVGAAVMAILRGATFQTTSLGLLNWVIAALLLVYFYFFAYASYLYTTLYRRESIQSGKQKDEIRQFNLALNAQKAEVQQQNIALAHQNQQLAKLNDEKSYLMSILAHDLRSPLHQIEGLCNLMENYQNNYSDEQRQSLQLIRKTARRMTQMVDGLLDQTVIETQQIQFSFQQVDLISLVQEVMQDLGDYAQNKRISIVLATEELSAKAWVDIHYAYLIFKNLVSNAIKYSPQGSKVLIQLATVDDSVLTEVIDEGQGVAPEQQSKLFQRYQTAGSQPTGGEKATGLGLSIVKKYVEAMHGQVWYEPNVPQGARFKVYFPVRAFAKS
jgi:signal transduction histidine kinase